MTPSQASDIKELIGSLDDLEEKFLTSKARSLIRELGKGVENSQDFFLDNIQQQMQIDATVKLGDFLEERGVVIHNVLFRDVTLPLVVSKAIIQTQQRQEEVNQEKAKLRIVEQKAQQQIIQAQAKEQAAKANANAKRTMADASAYTIKTVATAQAAGYKLISKTLNKDIIEANRVDKWDGKYPTTMLAGGTGVLLNVPIN